MEKILQEQKWNEQYSKNIMKTLNQLDSFDNLDLLIKYRSKNHVFPLIISVLEGTQEGVVYSDMKHTNYFVIHKFGFADLIGTENNSEFDSSLYHFFLETKFLNDKIRWYDVPEKWITKFKKNRNKNIQLAERVQLLRDSIDSASKQYVDDSVCVERITESNFDIVEINFNLSLGSRFWSSRQQFLNNALGIIVFKDEIPAALCYACAVANGIAEVDVFTKEKFRSQGLGKIAIATFINECIAREIKPHWDCYTNNISSYSLAQFFNFKLYNIYPHAIISK